jgi:hypothetical protein
MEREHLLSKIAQLSRLPIAELRRLWFDLYEKEAPPFNRKFLEARLAYRLQEIAFGGINDETLQRMRNNNQKQEENRTRREAFRPPIGTVLVREFKGIEHRVRVMRDGFDYQGIKYRSLTAIAHKITGTSWNGLRFFGLRNDRVKS